MREYLLPEKLRERIEKEVSALRSVAERRGETDMQTWITLRALESKFRKFAETTTEPWSYKPHLHAFLEEEWGICRTQQFQYLKVANHPALYDIKVSVARAILLASYDEETVRKFRRDFSDEQIAGQTCLELKILIDRNYRLEQHARRKEMIANGKSLTLNAEASIRKLKLVKGTGDQARNQDLESRIGCLPTKDEISGSLSSSFEQLKRFYRQRNLDWDVADMINQISNWKEEKQKPLDPAPALVIQLAA